MAQIFRPGANSIARLILVAIPVVPVSVLWLIGAYYRSSYADGVAMAMEQPVPFSHEHHVRGLGIDCRYCHTSVETSSFAGLPPTETCMTCHSQIWTNAEMLALVRQSLEYNRPLRWNRVNDLPDFVYFDHSIHVHKGVGCDTCHGPVDRMPLTWKAHSLYMKWCLECHRHPERYLRPREQVFNMEWQPPPNQNGDRLVKEYHVRVDQLTNCYICHR